MQRQTPALLTRHHVALSDEGILLTGKSTGRPQAGNGRNSAELKTNCLGRIRTPKKTNGARQTAASTSKSPQVCRRSLPFPDRRSHTRSGVAVSTFYCPLPLVMADSLVAGRYIIRTQLPFVFIFFRSIALPVQVVSGPNPSGLTPESRVPFGRLLSCSARAFSSGHPHFCGRTDLPPQVAH